MADSARGGGIVSAANQRRGRARKDGAQPRSKKDTSKLVGRFALDFAALRDEMERRSGVPLEEGVEERGQGEQNPALLRLKALEARDAEEPTDEGPLELPVDATRPNWTPLGPLAVPNGQTYGGARVLISGRVTAIAPHPTDGNRIYIGTSRGGVWRTDDAGETWWTLGDHEPSLAIGALAVARSNPAVIYAGTGEGNVQFYSTAFPLSSAPGVYLGVGVLRSTDGGATWANNGTALLANHSFYRIAVNPGNENQAFAATSRGLCRTTDGVTWTALSGGGLPAISATVIACTDVLVDASDATGNTVYAAFWRSGIYRSTNALSGSPTFTPLTTGLPTGSSTSRISLAQSPSSPARIYALIANSSDAFLGLYRTTAAAGASWELCTNDAAIELYGAFTSDVGVDPTTPDIVYVSGVELYKCQRTTTGTWNVANVGSNIHPDSHAIAFHPTLNETIYSGNDGGFYVSRDGGATWDDTPNEGLCLLQYEAFDVHPTADAFLQCGTQDNGTQQYRNSPVHYHSADGDGGYALVSKTNGRNVIHSWYGNTPRRSTAAGRFGTYSNVSAGIDGAGLFYPPSAISPSSERVAWATSVVNVDDAMGTGGWPGAGVALPGLAGRVSAVSFANDSLVYCATTSGQVFRLDRSASGWSARALHATPLPAGQWIWDVHSIPGDDATVLVAFSGFGLASHVWRGVVPASGTAAWTAVSSGLPDVPMYALAVMSATDWYVGTDIGVFRTTNGGGSWVNFTQGLPNTAIYDLRMRPGANLLRAATHGRGMWEIRTDVPVQPTVDLFVRDHVMDTGRPPSGAPARAAWDDPTRWISLDAPCYWWECADIKTDAPPGWQLAPSEVNYLNFETRLVHENPERGNQNRVFVQVHNRGPVAASNVTVKVMTAGASAGLPDLPADFWTSWPNSAGDANWTPLGAPQTIATLEPLRPTVLEWAWTPPASADAHTCMLVVLDSPDDPIPAAAKVFAIAPLVTGEKRAGLKNLHVVNLQADELVPIRLLLHASVELEQRYIVRLPRLVKPGLDISMLFSEDLSARVRKGGQFSGLVEATFSKKELELLRRRWVGEELRPTDSWDRLVEGIDVRRQYRLERKTRRGVDIPLDMPPGGHEEIILLARTQPGRSLRTTRLTIQQLTDKEELVGGSTFIFKRGERSR